MQTDDRMQADGKQKEVKRTAHSPSKINPLLDDLFRGQAAAYNAYKIRLK